MALWRFCRWNKVFDQFTTLESVEPPSSAAAAAAGTDQAVGGRWASVSGLARWASITGLSPSDSKVPFHHTMSINRSSLSNPDIHSHLNALVAERSAPSSSSHRSVDHTSKAASWGEEGEPSSPAGNSPLGSPKSCMLPGPASKAGAAAAETCSGLQAEPSLVGRRHEAGRAPQHETTASNMPEAMQHAPQAAEQDAKASADSDDRRDTSRRPSLHVHHSFQAGAGRRLCTGLSGIFFSFKAAEGDGGVEGHEDGVSGDLPQGKHGMSHDTSNDAANIA